MFGTSLLDEWWKRLDVLGEADKLHDGCVRAYGNTYDAFLQRQKDIWTPSELYEKCCPRFLAGGVVSRRNKNGQFVCCGGCHKIHPTITLYFDGDKNCTVATLSYRLDPFTKYFDQCVSEGSASWKSTLYYELNGFLRENLHRLRHHQCFFGGHLVKTAIGALRDSDAAQRSWLEEYHLRQHLRRHQPGVECDDAATTAFSSTNITTEPGQYQDYEKLEVVLEICRLWGLGDNLDVLSIDCMLRTSQVFRKVATPMAEKRVKECKFVVTPLVDGHAKSGYSVFRRADTSRERIIEREGGRLVEYAVGSSILCREKRDKIIENVSNEIARKKSLRGHFLPVACSNVAFNKNSDRNRNGSEHEEMTGFSWACEELSYTNLELEFMDTSVPEYVGQKVIVHWQCGNIDMPNQSEKNSLSTQDPHSSLLIPMMPVFRLKLDWASQKKGIRKFSAPHFDLKLDIQRTSALQVDEVTFLYKGNAKILECRADFSFLVAAYARSLEPCLKANHQQIETMRPLLRHEHTFLQEVQLAASVCSFSPHTYTCK